MILEALDIAWYTEKITEWEYKYINKIILNNSLDNLTQKQYNLYYKIIRKI